MIDGGTSSAAGDTLTGGLGLDIFKSGNAAAVDTLVETQDGGMSVSESHATVAALFILTPDHLRAIEREGLDNGWPPLTPLHTPA